MKFRLLSLAVLLVFASYPFIACAQSANVGAIPRADYDPAYAAHAAPIAHKSMAETLRQEYNPTGTNYGVLLQNLTSSALQDTIMQLYFWVMLFAVACLGLETIYVYYLRRERRRRLWISSEIVAQLYNLYFHAHEKAVSAIKAHNTLVQDQDKVTHPQPPVITMERPVLATLPDIYRQPDVVAEQRISAPTITIDTATDDPHAFASAAPAPSPIVPHGAALAIPASSPSVVADSPSDAISDGVDSRQPSSLEQAQRQITALQNKLRNTRQALNLRIDEVRSLKEQLGNNN